MFTSTVKSDGKTIDLAAKCLQTWRMDPKRGRKDIPGYRGYLPVSFLFAHGLFENKEQANGYTPSGENEWKLFTCPYFTFDFPTVKPGKKGGIEGSIGQEEDIRALLAATANVKMANWQTAVELPIQERNAKIMEEMVLVGTSRGALTAINALGKYPTKVGVFLKTVPPGKDPKRLPLRKAAIKALIAEAPTDTIVSYVYDRVKNNWRAVLNMHRDKDFNRYFKEAYGHEGTNPISAATKIDRTMPFLIVHSKKDTKTPINSSRVLYYFLQKRHSGAYEKGRKLPWGGYTRGKEQPYYPKAFLLELDEGEHGKYHLGKNADIYRSIVNAFYQHYGIPHDENLAKKGWDLILEGTISGNKDKALRKYLQPSREEIKERILKEEPRKT